METLLIILGAIGSALLGFGFSYFLQRLSYKDEYYKKLIDKRFQAYESVEELNSLLYKWTIREGKKHLHTIFTSEEELLKFFKIYSKIGAKNFLLSDSMYDIVYNFHQVVIKAIKPDIDNPKEERELKLLQFGFENFEKIRIIHSNIEDNMHEDLKSLHKVKKHLNEKKPSKARMRWLKLKHKLLKQPIDSKQLPD